MQVGKGEKEGILSRQICQVHSGHKEEMNLSGMASEVGRENQICSLQSDRQWTLKVKRRGLDWSSCRFSGK